MEAGLKKTTLYFPHSGPCLVGMLMLKNRSSLVDQLGEIAQEILLQCQAIVQSNFFTTTIDVMKTPKTYSLFMEANMYRLKRLLPRVHPTNFVGRTGNRCSIVRRNDWMR